jgi:hypothetical protein
MADFANLQVLVESLSIHCRTLFVEVSRMLFAPGPPGSPGSEIPYRVVGGCYPWRFTTR